MIMATLISKRTSRYYAGAAFGVAVLAAGYGVSAPIPAQSAEQMALLAGRVTGTDGKPLAGIPVKAHLNNTAITVAVYTDKSGEYSFPSWSDVKPGSYTVKVELPDFEHVNKDGVGIAAGKTQKIDFTLKSKPVAYDDATASEIIAGLPGGDQQKVLFSQCSNCHTLQWALQVPRTHDGWVKVVKMMAGRAAAADTPGTYAFSQKNMIEPLADYLTSIRGPGSSDQVPFKPRPRPTDTASTNLVVTEYDLPRGGERDVFMLRGDRQYVWPHDVIMDKEFAYYTDHFSYVLGRLDIKTGEAKETPFPLPAGAGREAMGEGDGRPGQPGGGAHELQFDGHGNVIVGMDHGTVKFEPKTGQFTRWSSGAAMFGLDPEGNVWHLSQNGQLTKVETGNEQLKRTIFPIPKNSGIYDIDTDSKGRTDLYIWRDDKIGIFDPRTIEYTDYQVPTPMSGPRRGQIDGKDRLWAGEFYAGQLMMFDPDKKIFKEYPLIPGTKPYTAPYAEPYSASADDKNQIVWTHDFSSSRLFRIDMNTGQSTEYMTPSNYEVRDLKVETGAPRPTVWIPAYRPPSKLVKIQVR
jgi:streptogramin lyase